MFMYSCSAQLISFEIESTSKEINCAEHEYMNISPSLIALAPLLAKSTGFYQLVFINWFLPVILQVPTQEKSTMASQRGGFSAILVLFLCLCLYLEVFKPYQTPANGAVDIMLALKLDKKQFPTRNTCGLPRYSVPYAGLPVVGLHLLNVTMAASSLVLLAGDVSMNPGPILDGLPRAHGLRVAHLNVRSLVNKMGDIGHLVQDKSLSESMAESYYIG